MLKHLINKVFTTIAKFPDSLALKIKNPDLMQVVRETKWFMDLSVDKFQINDVISRIGGFLNNALYVLIRTILMSFFFLMTMSF